MIPVYQEPKGLARDEKPLWDRRRSAMLIENAILGSEKLRDAILLAKGYTPPAKPKKLRAFKPIEPKHQPECCKECGSPLKPQSKLVAHIQAAVAAYYKLDKSTMQSARRSKNICHPRQIAMYLASELTPKSLPDIGRRFGGRDHTTVIHAIQAVKKRMEEDPEIALDVEALRFRLMVA